MRRIEQLAELCPKTLQRLEESSDTAGLLLQADQVLMLHGCSSVNDLLRTLSLADDRGLLRGVAAAGDGGAVRPNVSRKPVNTVVPFAPPRQGTPPSPAGLIMAQSPQKQEIPIPDPGSDSSFRSRQLIRELFDDVSRELEVRRQDVKEGRREKRLPEVFDRSTASHPFPDTPEEGAKADWFDKHPRHKSAARTPLQGHAEHFISVKKLEKWAAPTEEGDGAGGRDIEQQRQKNSSTVLVPEAHHLAAGGTPDHGKRAAAKEQRTIVHAVSPAGRPPPPHRVEKSPAASHGSQAGVSGQLQQLLEKWQPQNNKETTQRRKEHITEERTLEPAAVLLPPGRYVPERQGTQHGFVGESKNPMDDDQYFSETLERILRREIRRHGIEEDS